jgi:hypothetical protein
MQLVVFFGTVAVIYLLLSRGTQGECEEEAGQSPE